MKEMKEKTEGKLLKKLKRKGKEEWTADERKPLE